MSTLSLAMISILVAAADGPVNETTVAEPNSIEPQSIEIQTDEPQSTEPQATEIQSNEPENNASQSSEPAANEPLAAALTSGQIFERGDFRILHADAEDAAEQVAHELATLQAEFEVWLESLGVKGKPPRAPLLVLLVTPEELHAMRASFGLPADTRGFYRREVNMAVFPKPEKRLTAIERRVIRHEGLHLLQFNSGLFDREAADPPLWLLEGLAVRFENGTGDLCADPVRVEEFLRKYPQPQSVPNLRAMLLSNQHWDHARDQVVAGMLVRWLENEAPAVLRRALMVARQDEQVGDWIDVFAARGVHITDRFKKTLYDAVHDCRELAAQGQ